MRLAAFIRENIEQISAEWERFAATLLPEREFSALVLRNSIVDLLNEFATDMDCAQSAEQQEEKSQGAAPQSTQPTKDAAARHALSRVNMGMSSQQLVSEFRALRATVIRLWQRSGVKFDELSFYDLTRFNEAVDQALTEAAARYGEEIDRSRELFLGILGHDLRNPLGAISGCTELQLRAETPDRHKYLASQTLISVRRMSHMITDLIELTRVRLGSGIAINPAPTSLRRICVSAIEEMKAIYPSHIFQLNCDDELPGEWDDARMGQVLSNLLGNAVKHGAAKSPISVTAKRDGGWVELAVHNKGTTIPPDMIPKLFDFFFRGGSGQRTASDHSASLGLGLYIAKQIMLAHGGTIAVQSSDDGGTTFVAGLPSAA